MPILTREIAPLSEEDQLRFWSKVDKNGPLPDQSNPHYRGLGKCWVWTAGRVIGYGAFKCNGKQLRAHRVAFFLANGMLPAKGFACHRCDNKACCNPNHIFDGSAALNSRDMVLKNRSAKGQRTGRYTHPESTARGDRHGTRTHPEKVCRGENHYARQNPSRMARGESHGTHTHPESLVRGEKHHRAKLTAANVLEIRRRHSEGETYSELGPEFGVNPNTVSRVVNGKSWAHVTIAP